MNLPDRMITVPWHARELFRRADIELTHRTLAAYVEIDTDDDVDRRWSLLAARADARAERARLDAAEKTWAARAWKIGASPTWKLEVLP